MERNKPFRNHPFYILGALGKFFVVIILLAYNLLEGILSTEAVKALPQSKYIFIALAVFLVTILLVEFSAFLIWRRIWFTVTDKVLIKRSGNIIKNEKTIELEKIVNLNISQHMLEHILGICKVKVETNATFVGNESDLVLMIKMAQVDELRHIIFANQKSSQPEQVKELEHQHIAEGATLKKVLQHCFFYTGPLGILFLVACSVFIILAFAFEAAKGGSILGCFILGSGLVVGMIRSIAVYFQFTSYREKDKIHLRYGLFTQRIYQIPIKKIVGVSVISPMLARMTGRSYVKIICAGIGNEEKELTEICLIDKNSKIKEKCEELLPEFCSLWEDRECMEREPKEVVSVGLVMAGITFLILGSILGCTYIQFSNPFVLWIGLGIVVCIPLIQILYAFLTYRTSGYYEHKDYIVVQSGFLRKEMHMFYKKDVQHTKWTQGPLLRWKHLAQGYVYLKSGEIAGFVEISLNCHKENG